MVSRLRLCRAIQSARASASATVPIASTSTASYSPKIKVDVIGSKPSASPKGFGRSPTIVFPGAVKTFTPSVFDATAAVPRVPSFRPFVPSIQYPLRCQSERLLKPKLPEARPRVYWTNVSAHTKALVGSSRRVGILVRPDSRFTSLAAAVLDDDRNRRELL